MKPVDYDDVASEYDRRFERNRYDGTESCLHRFLRGDGVLTVAEIGCGTGHWLADASNLGVQTVLGVDLSAAMLERAQTAAPSALLVRATADRLPLADVSLDRVFCINAFHHFEHKAEFVSECSRVLRPGGGVLTIGLDPHAGGDQWWVYDYFPAALQADRERYLPRAAIHRLFADAGFEAIATEVAQHIPVAVPFEVARGQGFVDRQSTSQLMVISDEDYAAGMRRLLAEKPVLRADLRSYATTAWITAD